MGSKITEDSDCSHEIRRQLLYGRKAMISLDSLLKSRNITLPTKVHIFEAMVSQWSGTVVRAGHKKAECQRIDAFELWCWRKLMNVFWTTRRSYQSILRKINPEYSLKD